MNKAKKTKMFRQQKITFFSLFLMSLIAVAFLTPSQAQAQSVMRIAAVVNDDVISAHDLGQRIRLTMTLGRMQDSQELRRRLASSILRTMVDEKLMLQEVERLGIEISEERLQDGIDRFARVQRIRPDRFNELLESIEVDPLIVEEQARAQIGWNLAVRRTGEDRLVVTDKEVNFAMAALQENIGKPEYLYSEIFLPIENLADEANVQQTAQRLIDFIKSGSPFGALARDFSKSASASRGGDLGWVQTGNIAPQLEARLKDLPLGTYSNPIRTPSGLYILHARDKRISGSENTEDLFRINQIVFRLPAQATSDIRDAKMNEARNVMRQVQSCENLTEIAQTLQNVQSGILEDFKASNSPPEIRQTLVTMQAGEITTLTQGNRAIIVLMVCDRQKQDAKPESLVKREIRNRIFAEKIALEERRQLNTLRRNAIVDIRL